MMRFKKFKPFKSFKTLAGLSDGWNDWNVSNGQPAARLGSASTLRNSLRLRAR